MRKIRKRLMSSFLAIIMILSTFVITQGDDFALDGGEGESYYAEENEALGQNLPPLFPPVRPADAQIFHSGLIGFDGEYALADDERPVSVIVLFEHSPAGVQVAASQMMGRSALSLNIAEQIVANEHELFRQELSRLFSSRSLAAGRTYEIHRVFHHALNGVNITIPSNMVEQIAMFDSVRAIFPNEILEFEFPEPEYLAQNNPPGMAPGRASMRADDLHALGHRGTGVVVAVLDTGVDYNHPAFAGTFPTLADMHARGAIHITEDDLINGYFKGRNLMYLEDGAQPNDPYDVDRFGGFGHGTHVAGTIVGQNTGSSQSILGVAPDALVFHYRVIESFTPLANVLAGIEMVTIDRPDVINMSLGWGPGHNPRTSPVHLTSIAVNNVKLAHPYITFVISAGNSGTSADFLAIGSPGSATTAITVASATAHMSGVSSFSSRGPVVYSFEIKPDITAHGSDVWSAWPGGGYRSASGTSMSAPHIAGAVALMLEYAISTTGQPWTSQEIKARMMNTAQAFGNGVFVTGAGYVDVYAAARGSAFVYVMYDRVATQPGVAFNNQDFMSVKTGSFSFGGFSNVDTAPPRTLIATISNPTNTQRTFYIEYNFTNNPNSAANLSLSTTTLTIPPNQSADFSATLQMNPTLAAAAFYEGFVYVWSEGDLIARMPFAKVSRIINIHFSRDGFNAPQGIASWTPWFDASLRDGNRVLPGGFSWEILGDAHPDTMIFHDAEAAILWISPNQPVGSIILRARSNNYPMLYDDIIVNILYNQPLNIVLSNTFYRTPRGIARNTNIVSARAYDADGNFFPSDFIWELDGFVLPGTLIEQTPGGVRVNIQAAQPAGEIQLVARSVFPGSYAEMTIDIFEPVFEISVNNPMQSTPSGLGRWTTTVSVSMTDQFGQNWTAGGFTWELSNADPSTRLDAWNNGAHAQVFVSPNQPPGPLILRVHSNPFPEIYTEAIIDVFDGQLNIFLSPAQIGATPGNWTPWTHARIEDNRGQNWSLGFSWQLIGDIYGNTNFSPSGNMARVWISDAQPHGELTLRATAANLPGFTLYAPVIIEDATYSIVLFPEVIYNPRGSGRWNGFAISVQDQFGITHTSDFEFEFIGDVHPGVHASTSSNSFQVFVPHNHPVGEISARVSSTTFPGLYTYVTAVVYEPEIQGMRIWPNPLDIIQGETRPIQFDGFITQHGHTIWITPQTFSWRLLGDVMPGTVLSSATGFGVNLTIAQDQPVGSELYVEITWLHDTSIISTQAVIVYPQIPTHWALSRQTDIGQQGGRLAINEVYLSDQRGRRIQGDFTFELHPSVVSGTSIDADGTITISPNQPLGWQSMFFRARSVELPNAVSPWWGIEVISELFFHVYPNVVEFSPVQNTALGFELFQTKADGTRFTRWQNFRFAAVDSHGTAWHLNAWSCTTCCYRLNIWAQFNWPEGDMTITGHSHSNIDSYFTITIFVNPYPAPSIRTTSLPAGNLGAQYNFALEATGAGVISWDLHQGSLPNGLTINSDGVISGIPTVYGLFEFTIRAQNGNGSSDRVFSIYIAQNAIGDLNGDGIIDGTDLTYLLGYWGAVGSGHPADFNGDGVVDGTDLMYLLGLWSAGNSAAMSFAAAALAYPAISISREPVATRADNYAIHRLVFAINSPEVFSGLVARFSFDNTIIMPVQNSGGFADRPPGDTLPPAQIGQSFRTMDDAADFGISQIGPITRLTEANRTGFALAYAGDPNWPAAANEIVEIFAFYFRIIGNDVNYLAMPGAFRLEDGREAGHMVRHPAPVAGIGVHGFEIATAPGTMGFGWGSIPEFAGDRRQIPDGNIVIDMAIPPTTNLPVFSISNAFSSPGRTAILQIQIENNPGFASATMRIDFPSELTLTRFDIGQTNQMNQAALLNGFVGTAEPGIPLEINDFVYFGWLYRNADIIGDGAIITLTFLVDEHAGYPEFYDVSINFVNHLGDPDAPRNLAGDLAGFSTANGGVFVEHDGFGGRVGDINGDGFVTSRDTTVLAMFLHAHGGSIHIATQWQPEFAESINHPRAADVNGDGYIDFADVILLARLLVGHTVPIVR